MTDRLSPEPNVETERGPIGDGLDQEFEKEFLATLEDFGVLDAFYRMEPSHQSHFLSVIGMTDEPVSRRRRILTFVGALRASPIAGAND